MLSFIQSFIWRYKVELQIDPPYNYFENQPLAKRRELSEKYTTESEVVVICEPLKQKQQTSAGAGSSNQRFIFVLSKKDPIKSLFPFLSKKLIQGSNEVVLLKSNTQLLSWEETFGNIHEKNKNEEDNFLYLQYFSLEIS